MKQLQLTCSVFLLISTLQLLIPASARLSIVYPDPLANLFVGNQINYQVAAFGEVPTGKKLIGSVVLSDPQNGCDPISVVKGDNLQDSPFILVYRGVCTYVSKVRHVQAVGGKMAIIVDNLDETPFTMADDGQGFTIEIPAIIIKKHDGDLIQEAIMNSKGEQSQVKMLIKFEDYDQKTLHFSFFLDLHDLASSYNFIRKFHQRVLNVGVDADSLGKNDFEPFYKTFQLNTEPDIVDDPTKDHYLNCYNNGHYCGSIRAHVEQTIRQKCLYKTDYQNWWKFNSAMAEQHIKQHVIDFDHAKARGAIFTQLNVNQAKVESCYNQSFVSVGENKEIYLIKNSLLENEKLNFHIYNISFIPAIALNHRVFHRAQNFRETAQDQDDYIDHIVYSICEILPNPTDQCQIYMNQRKKVENSNYINEFPELEEDNQGPHAHSVGIIIGIIVFLLLIFLIFAYLFRRAIINEYNEQNKEIDKQVTEYVNLHKSNKKIQAL